MKKVAIFASGNGSNFQALAEASLRKELNADICLLVCDQPEAYVVKRARNLGIPVFSFRAKEYPSKEAFENEIASELAKRGVEWIILAGYMRLIGSTLLNRYRNRIVNIHPSLLPAFPGKDAIGQALDAGVKVTGLPSILSMKEWIPGRSSLNKASTFWLRTQEKRFRKNPGC